MVIHPPIFLEKETPAAKRLAKAVASVSLTAQRFPIEGKVGMILGDYRLKAELGSGGSARVFLAEQISLGRDVALKVMHPRHAGDARRAARFVEEAEQMAQFNDPGIVQVYESGESLGVKYFSMELVPGLSVKQLIGKGPRPIDWSLRVAEKIACALQHAWEKKGLIHRDVKPDNVMIRNDGAVKLADFGLAGPQTRTCKGDVVEGSPHYLAPEVVLGEDVDFRSDVYSLGATLYHMVCGSFPFTGDGPIATVRMHLRDRLEPPRDRNPEVPEEVSALICRMMAKKANDRFASYDELIGEINRVRTLLKNRSVRIKKVRVSRRSFDFQIARNRVNGFLGSRAASLATAVAVAMTLFVGAVGLGKSTRWAEWLPQEGGPAAKATSLLQQGSSDRSRGGRQF